MKTGMPTRGRSTFMWTYPARPKKNVFVIVMLVMSAIFPTKISKNFLKDHKAIFSIKRSKYEQYNNRRKQKNSAWRGKTHEHQE